MPTLVFKSLTKSSTLRELGNINTPHSSVRNNVWQFGPITSSLSYLPQKRSRKLSSNSIWRGEEENKKINLALVLDEEMAAELEKEGETGSVADLNVDPEDVAMRALKRSWKERPTILWAPFSDGLAIICAITLISLGLSAFTCDSHLRRAHAQEL